MGEARGEGRWHRMLTNTLVYGLINSMVLLLTTLGFSLVFGLSGVANLAHGGLYVLSGYLTWLVLKYLGLPLIPAAVMSILIVALFGALIYRVVVLPVRGISLSEVVATYGVLVVVLEFFRWRGFITYEFNLPVFVKGGVTIAGVVVDYQRLLVVGIAFALMLLLWLFTHYSRFGLALRGIAQDEYTALSLGIDSDWAATLSLALGGALAAVAAITILPLGIITVNVGYDVLVVALAVAVLGGLESTTGLVIASFILGYTQSFVANYVGSHWTEMVYFVAVILVLALKPSGLLGKFQELEERV